MKIIPILILLFLLVSPVWAEQVTWTPPTINEDGTLLDDLAGYNVIWLWSGLDPNGGPIYVAGVILIDDPEAASVELNPSGLTYIWIKARDYSGNLSEVSDVVVGYYQ